MAPVKICTRPSCGATLPPVDASSSSSFETAYALEGACKHHPGQPVFHEGQKSWSCCNGVNKPVLDFDDFVKIQGCTTVEGHSTEKVKKKEKKELSEGQKGVVGEDGKEIFGTPVTSSAKKEGQPAVAAPITTPSIPSTSSAKASTPSAPAAPPAEPSDPEGVAIPAGTTCKRPGCAATYQGAEGTQRDRSSEVCHYHRGFPIFHEGSKGYSCCKRRVLDFADFMRIEPCSTAESGHLFIQPLKSKSKPQGTANGHGEGSSTGLGGDDLLRSKGMTLREGEEEIDCRMDHYETPDEIRMTVYSKGVKMEDSSIEIAEEDVLLSLSLPPAPGATAPRRHLLHLPLYAALDPAGSSYKVSPSRIKIDLVLRKKQAGASWPTLIRGGPQAGYGLTFGRK
ncbi:chord-domain-containing protein [Microstroma glucosiphilum]|uniref:Chord-domain-containing protein n=1 Tax=Pseudomicrostroma glucosiphilum TaxID=1684307 RepID=A0A316UFV4_9BASI|nr:chord-domain-containing protein [Pseudomicrostroma glucosiphilum]PWN24207.1 chord-domain-containing protein [Pseudomicrostroma glucosiphilum]